MPIYEYECKKCKQVFEEIRSIGSADLPAKCQNCKSVQTERILSNFFSKNSSSVSGSGRSTCSSCSGRNCASCQ